MARARLRGIQIDVPDRSQAVRFYAEGLGLEITAREDDRTVLDAAGLELVIVEVEPHETLSVRLLFQTGQPLEIRRELNAVGVDATSRGDETDDELALSSRDPSGQLVDVLPKGIRDLAEFEARRRAAREAQEEQTEPEEQLSPEERAARRNEVRESAVRFAGSLKKQIDELRDMLLGSATGRLAIADHEERYKRTWETVDEEIDSLRHRGAPIEHENPHDTLLSFFRHWSRSLPSRGKKEGYVEELYDETLAFLREMAETASSGGDLAGLFGGRSQDPFVVKGETVLHDANPFTDGDEESNGLMDTAPGS